MSKLTLRDIAEKMRGIDIAILTTRAKDGEMAGRPMSNNGDVEYDGDSWYFTFEQAHSVAEIEADPRVGLGFSGPGTLYVAVAGKAELIRDKAVFVAHWTPELDRWFKDGIDTPGIVLIKVHAHRVKIWENYKSEEIKI